MTDQPTGYLGPFGIRHDPPPGLFDTVKLGPTYPVPAPPRRSLADVIAGNMAAAMRHAFPSSYVSGFAMPVKRGDKVKLSATFYVGKVNADGTVTLASTRDAFPEPVTLDRCHTSRLSLVERVVYDFRIGDTITADMVRATPWRRGTLIRYTAGTDHTDGGRYVLMSDGNWRNVEHGAAIPFGHLCGRFVIEHAPGK